MSDAAALFRGQALSIESGQERSGALLRLQLAERDRGRSAWGAGNTNRQIVVPSQLNPRGTTTAHDAPFDGVRLDRRTVYNDGSRPVRAEQLRGHADDKCLHPRLAVRRRRK